MKKSKSKEQNKRPRDGDEDKTHVAASRKNQFRENKLQRKLVKPDNELVEQAKVIYNVVKPNDVRTLSSGELFFLIFFFFPKRLLTFPAIERV